MAEKPTSSSTMYTTFGAPTGALAGSNGDQSGSESRMSTLIDPRNLSGITNSSQATFWTRVAVSSQDATPCVWPSHGVSPSCQVPNSISAGTVLAVSPAGDAGVVLSHSPAHKSPTDACKN